MLGYAATIFLSAFLLFLVQPLIAKQILPWFGGSAAVWTTCLVFFQTALLAGYAYSDIAMRRLAPRSVVLLHTVLLLASLAVLPIVPGAHWKPGGEENPAWLILGLLAATIGPPFFLLSTTSPLLQAWLARARPGASPYRFFALSNLASMLALLGYPFLLEPWLPTRTQAFAWSIGYAIFVVLCTVVGWWSLRPARAQAAAAQRRGPSVTRQGRVAASLTPVDEDSPPTAARQVLWGVLAASGSLLLLAVSNHITQNIAAVPLLWIVPLAIYLLTFILCFEGTRWYRRPAFLLVLVPVGLCGMGWTLADPTLTYALGLQIGVFCLGLFLACMFCHGELVRLKPAPTYLTRFYLLVSLGGAAGAVLVGIVAPLVLPAHFELAGGLVLVAALLLWQARREHVAFRAAGLAVVLMTAGCAVFSISEYYKNTIVATRNFYGVLRVSEEGREASRRRELIHGSIMHGMQFLQDDLLRTPTAYFTPSSGIGRLLDALHEKKRPLKVGIIGLGVGTLAAYGEKGDIFRFYELNPQVVTIAQRDFTYLKDSEATIEIKLGDARLSLEREPNQDFDLLVVDAFSSDAIPMHLITAEALEIYKRHMKPGGVIAFQVTNRFVNLVPVVEALAHVHRLFMIDIATAGQGLAPSRSEWVLLSDKHASLDVPALTQVAKQVEVRKDWRLWTDDFNNLAQALKSL